MDFPDLPDPPEEIRNWWREIEPALLRFAESRLQQQSSYADDVVSEAFYAFLASRIWVGKELSNNKAQWRSWIFTATKRRAIDQLRKHSSRKKHPVRWRTIASADEDTLVDLSGAHHELAEMMEHVSHLLSPRHSQVLLLRVEGYNDSQIADELGVSPQTVGRWFRKIKSALTGGTVDESV